MLTAHCSLVHCSLLTNHCSTLTAQCSVLTNHCSPLTAQCSLLTAHCSLKSSLADKPNPRFWGKPTKVEKQLLGVVLRPILEWFIKIRNAFLNRPAIIDSKNQKFGLLHGSRTFVSLHAITRCRASSPRIGPLSSPITGC